MNIIDEPKIRDKYFYGFDRIDEPEEIVIHGTGGGASAAAIIQWMYNGERAERYKKGIGLFHYLIDRNGDIYKLIEDYKWVYHSEAGKRDALTIGVELMNPGSANTGEYTSEQYAALSELVEFYVLLGVRIISNHDRNRAIYSNLPPKGCPGNFDFDAFYAGLKETITFTKIDQYNGAEVHA